MQTDHDVNANTSHGGGLTAFTVTYDDTGAETTVAAPNGWKIRMVIEKAYEQLGEVPRTGDRVEANGVSLAPYLEMHVKEFVEQGIAPDRHFNIVSNTGGADRRSLRGRL